MILQRLLAFLATYENSRDLVTIHQLADEFGHPRPEIVPLRSRELDSHSHLRVRHPHHSFQQTLRVQHPNTEQQRSASGKWSGRLQIAGASADVGQAPAMRTN